MSKRRSSTSSISEILTFPFRSEHAANRLLAGVGLLFLSIIIPILPALVVYGYLIQIMREVIDGRSPGLPEWTDWGRLFVDGLKAFLVGLVYLLPAGLVMGVGTGLYCGVSILGIALSEGAGAQSAASDAFGPLLFVSIVVFFLSISIGAVLSMLGALPLPAAEASLSANDSLGSAFAFGKLLRVIRANLGGYIVAWLLLAGMWAFIYWAMMLVYYTIVLACLLPVIIMPVSYYSMLVAAALFGDAYREGAEILAEGRQS